LNLKAKLCFETAAGSLNDMKLLLQTCFLQVCQISSIPLRVVLSAKLLKAGFIWSPSRLECFVYFIYLRMSGVHLEPAFDQSRLALLSLIFETKTRLSRACRMADLFFLDGKSPFHFMCFSSSVQVMQRASFWARGMVGEKFSEHPLALYF